MSLQDLNDLILFLNSTVSNDHEAEQLLILKAISKGTSQLHENLNQFLHYTLINLLTTILIKSNNVEIISSAFDCLCISVHGKQGSKIMIEV